MPSGYFVHGLGGITKRAQFARGQPNPAKHSHGAGRRTKPQQSAIVSLGGLHQVAGDVDPDFIAADQAPPTHHPSEGPLAPRYGHEFPFGDGISVTR